MNYSEIRSKIKSGDILAWSNVGWKSWHDIQVQLVRMATRSEYSHIGIAWVIGGRVFIIEAVGSGVRIFPLSKALPFFLIQCGKDYWSKEITEFLLGTVGDKYSKKDAIMAFFDQLVVGEDSDWQCAELAVKALTMGKLIEGKVLATPTKVVDTLLNKGYKLTKVT